ncbi:hypothetical protein [Spongiimicrobium sp. 2-473A-2-J]|uniref:hypothetical protein n=1 Tax=Eudoraea algarum TaxID=3417568 RepID=UPI003D35E824
MIFIYLDWNVISQMKSGHHKHLSEYLRQPNRIVTLYSTSHIGDLFSSYKDESDQLKTIEEDLEFITSVTDNCCLSNNGKEVRLGYDDPKRLFDQRVDQKDLFENFSLDKLAEIFEGDPLTSSLGKTFVKLIKSMPLDKAFKDALSNPESANQLNKIFPGLKENPTMEGFFSSFGKMITNLNHSEDYKGLRGMVQSGLKINRDKLFDTNNPHESIDKAYEKLGIGDLSYNQQTDKNAPKWFNEISNDYIMLDMHGYQEDRVNTRKGRKETFSNTTEDSFHAGFGSTCNFYIINDKRAYKKTNKVYEKFELDTLVFKPQEFITYYDTYLVPRSYEFDLQIPFEYLKLDDYIEEKTESEILRTYHVPHFLFDFFNKMLVVANEDGKIDMIVLSQIAPTNKRITYYFEIERLSPKLFQALGEDDDGLGEIKQPELEQEEWQGRKWEFESISLRFIRTQGIYQLYYDFKD